MCPSCLRPAKDNKTFRLHSPLQLGPDLFKYTIQLPGVTVFQRDLERQYSPVYCAEAAYAEKPGIQYAKPHLSDQIQVVYGHHTRIKPEYNQSIGHFLPLSAHFLKNRVPFRPLRSQGRHFYDNLAFSPCGKCGNKKENDHKAKPSGKFGQKARSKKRGAKGPRQAYTAAFRSPFRTSALPVWCFLSLVSSFLPDQISCCFVHLNQLRKRRFIRPRSHRARRCAMMFESRWLGASSILIASACSSSFLNSARFCIATSTVSAKQTRGAALRPPDSCIARARSSRARSADPPPAPSLPPSYTIMKS